MTNLPVIREVPRGSFWTRPVLPVLRVGDTGIYGTEF